MYSKNTSYMSNMKNEQCICQTIQTNRIGEVYAPVGANQHRLAYRFALDCPVHGIRTKVDGKWVQQDLPKTKEQKEEERIERNKEIRKERRRKRMAKKKQDEKKRIK